MLKKIARLLVHVTMLALVCAIGAYWVIKIVTPAPSAPPPPVAIQAPRAADPVLAARMFGLVQAPQTAMSNVQVGGIFAAGKDSAAILAADGKPGRAVLLGQEVSPGTRLVEVQPESVTLETGGVRREVRLPARPPVNFGAASPRPAGFSLQGGTLSAPSAPASAAAPMMGRAGIPRLPAAPAQPVQPGPMTAPQPTRSDAPFPLSPAGQPVAGQAAGGQPQTE